MITNKKIEPDEFMFKLLNDINIFYQTNSCGGDLHIVLDDDNIEDRFIHYCLDNTNDEFAIDIAKRLLQVPVNKRIWITYNAGCGTPRDIYYEVEYW